MVPRTCPGNRLKVDFACSINRSPTASDQIERVWLKVYDLLSTTQKKLRLEMDARQ